MKSGLGTLNASEEGSFQQDCEVDSSMVIEVGEQMRDYDRIQSTSDSTSGRDDICTPLQVR